MKTVCFDVGYSSLKTTEYQIPAVIGPARELHHTQNLGMKAMLEELMLELDGKGYFVGEQALRQSDSPRFSLNNNRYDAEEGKVLAETALALLAGSGETVEVITGLPVDHYAQQKTLLKKSLEGFHRVRLCGENKITVVHEAVILLQPMGTFFHHVINDDGSPRESDAGRLKTGVIDIGYGTTDIIVMEGFKMQEHKSRSNSAVAMNQLNRLVSDEVHKAFGQRWEPHEMDSIVQAGALSLRGKRHDVQDLVHACKEKLARQLVNWLQIQWPDHAKLDRILLGGGGGAAMADTLGDAFHVTLVSDPQKAVVKGYGKYAALMKQLKSA